MKGGGEESSQGAGGILAQVKSRYGPPYSSGEQEGEDGTFSLMPSPAERSD